MTAERDDYLCSCGSIHRYADEPPACATVERDDDEGSNADLEGLDDDEGSSADVEPSGPFVPVPPDPGAVSDWARLRHRTGLSLPVLARLSGLDVGQVGLIDSGRVVARPPEIARLLRVLRPHHPGVIDAPPLAAVARPDA